VAVRTCDVETSTATTLTSVVNTLRPPGPISPATTMAPLPLEMCGCGMPPGGGRVGSGLCLARWGRREGTGTDGVSADAEVRGLGRSRAGLEGGAGRVAAQGL
jgi:hypothetical protein